MVRFAHSRRPGRGEAMLLAGITVTTAAAGRARRASAARARAGARRGERGRRRGDGQGRADGTARLVLPRRPGARRHGRRRGDAVHEMAAAVLGQEIAEQPELAERPQAHPPAALSRRSAGRCRGRTGGDGAELAGALAEQLRQPFGVAGVAVWLLDADGALEMLGAEGLGGTESSRWRRLPPQFDCAEQRVAFTGEDLWGPTGPRRRGPAPGHRAVGQRRGPRRARAAAPVRRPARRGRGLVAGARSTTSTPPRAAGCPRRSPGSRSARRAHGERHGRVDRARLQRCSGRLTRSPTRVLIAPAAAGPRRRSSPISRIMHVSPGYVDPAGRPASALAGLTLLEAYPSSGSADGLFARANRVLATGRAECAQAPSPRRSTGGKDAVEVTGLRVAPFFAGVICTWRQLGEPERLADLLGNAQRLGRIGGWDENLTTGTVRWTSAAFALFGLDPEQAAADPHRRPAQLRHRSGPGRRPAVPAVAAADQGIRRRGVPYRPARRHGGQADPHLRRAGPRRRATWWRCAAPSRTSPRTTRPRWR